MKAIIEGLYTLKKDRALGLQLIKKYLRVDDEIAGIGYDYYVAKHGDGILSLPERRGLELVIEQVAREKSQGQGTDAGKFGTVGAKHSGRDQEERVYREAQTLSASINKVNKQIRKQYWTTE